jgi:murein DD-endopeptidase MepM/ murein hydrolase activator NlpD
MTRGGRASGALAIALTIAACSSSRAATETTAATTTPTITAAAAPATAPAPSTIPATTTAPTTTIPATTESATTARRPTAAPPATLAPTTTTTALTTTAPTTTTIPTTTPYGMPVVDAAHSGYAHEHHDYPASDVFVPEGCGSTIISPVNGVVLESRRVDGWDRTTDNPATRGGKSIAILGDDGVRYYLAHFNDIATDIEPGVRIEIGHVLGIMGMTGKAGACHVHVGISPPCPGKEWAVRRGVIWPWRYLDAWRTGEQLSPLAEIEHWVADHPTACQDAIADPDAPLS